MKFYRPFFIVLALFNNDKPDIFTFHFDDLRLELFYHDSGAVGEL
jgi:hypothetical protein